MNSNPLDCSRRGWDSDQALLVCANSITALVVVATWPIAASQLELKLHSFPIVRTMEFVYVGFLNSPNGSILLAVFLIMLLMLFVNVRNWKLMPICSRIVIGVCNVIVFMNVLIWAVVVWIRGI